MIPNPKIYISARNPIKSPSPDLKNKNRIANTSIQITNVKRYLQNIKKHHKAQHPQVVRGEILQTLSPSIQSSRLQQQSLRKRIYELEIENNQFRVIAKECEMLAKRNHELEEQMLLLLSEIQGQEEQRQQNQPEHSELSSARIQKQEVSTKERFFTAQSSSKEELQHDIEPKAFRTGSSQKERVRTEPFQDVNLSSRRKQKQYFSIEGDKLVANEHSKLKELVDHEIKAALEIFELKFIKYIQSIEQKLQEMKKNNAQMLEFKVSNHQAFGYSESSSNGQKQPEYKYQTSSRKKYKQSSENSLVNIEIESCTDSNPSFGKSKTRKHEDKLFPSPEPINKSIYQEYQESLKKESEDPINSKFTQIVIQRVYENIEYLRENLTFILGEKSKINQPLIAQFQEKVYNELSNLLSTFFSDRKREVCFSVRENELLNENIQMRFRIRELSDEICGLKKDLKVKVDEECQASSPRINSSRHLDLLSRSAIPLSIGWQHFEQTERRLVRVINIMRSFNQQYHHILQRSRALSAQLQRSKTEPL